MTTKARLQDWIALALGAWVASAPLWMPGYASAVSTAAWSSYALGILVMLFALVALIIPRRWEEWLEVALGILLVVSPFAMLFHATERGAAWNLIVAGVLIVADALWALLQRPAFARRT